MKRNLTQGSVFKNLVFFSLPYLLSYFLQTLYGMADLFIVGQYNTVAATTAVSVGSQVMHMLTVMIVGLAMGSTVSIGQAIGGNDSKGASKSTGNTATLFMVLSLIITALLIALVKPIVSVMSTPEAAVADTVKYLTICFAGIPFITAYNIISSVFRGIGESKSPMYFIAVACAANIMLDYLFIGAMHLGAAGAALGTVISQALSVAVSLAVIIKRDIGVRLCKSDFYPDRNVLGKILKIGLPICLQDGLIQIAFIVITVIANRRGLTDAAAVGIVEKIIGFLFLVPSSLLSAVSALSAQNIGANKPRRAVLTLRYAIITAVIFGIAVSVTAQFTAEYAVGLFTSDKDVAAAGGQYLRGYIFDCIFAGIHFSFSGYFCAMGKSLISFIHNITAIAAVRIPGVYLASKLYPSTMLPMGLATAAGSLLSVIICVIAFAVIQKKESRKNFG